MPNQDVIDQAANLAAEGPAGAAPDNAPVTPPRYSFNSFDDFRNHLVETLDATAEGEGLRGSMSRRGPAQPGSLGDPVLDAISSPQGLLVIGDETIDLRGAGAPAATDEQGVGVIAHAAPLQFTGIVNGAERWAATDGSLVEYRLGTGRLVFHAWKKKNITQYWSMGGEISVFNTPAKFQVADIESRYYMSVDTPCQIVRIDRDSDRNDTYVDEYEWGWNSQQPERVASRCRAVWHNAKFADIVTAGSGCEDAPNDPNNPWDAGFPPEWNTVATLVNLNGDWTDGSNRNAAITVEFASLKVNMSAFGRPTANGTVDGYDSITVTFPDDATYTGQLVSPNRIRWSNNSTWTKVVNTVIDLNGNWTDGSDRTAVIYAGAQTIKVDMSDYDRPNASGTIVNASNINVKFPDDQTYTAQLQAPNVIRWSNNSIWTKRP